jgi:hypothetical protein
MRGKITEPRVIAAGIAAACMLLDDLPDSQYGTFRDPGAAAMLSIILADGFTLWGRRGWKPLIYLTFGIALVFKFFIQPFFWVRNAGFLDSATLLIAHGVFSFLAVRRMNLWADFICVMATVTTLTLTLLLLYLISLFSTSWLFDYWELAAARIVIPCVFWTVVLLVEKHCIEPCPEHPCHPV